MTVLIANTIDLAAALIQVGTGAIKQKAKYLTVQIIQLVMQAVSMLMLGGVTGAANNILCCFRNYLCYKEKMNTMWKIILIAASAVMTVLLNEQGLLGIIPAFVGAIYIVFMDTKDPIKFKILAAVTFTPWIFYSFIIKSYVGTICNAATVITSIVTIRAMIKEKNCSQSKSNS